MEYLLNVNIHAFQGLRFKDKSMEATLPTVYMVVAAYDKKMQTETYPDTSSAECSEFFSLSMFMTHDDFIVKSDVTITLMHSYLGGLRSMEVGSFTFGLAKIHQEREHRIVARWCELSLSGKPDEITGFVQVSLGVACPGEAVPRLLNTAMAAEVAGPDLPLKARVIERPRAGECALYQLTVRVQQADALREPAGGWGISHSVQATYNGVSLRTAVQKGAKPVWNAEVRIPFVYPSWDEICEVSLLNERTSAEVGHVAINIQDLVKHSLQPTWTNFYCAPVFNGGLFSEAIEQSPSEYAGRLCISANVDRTEQAIADVGNSKVQGNPL